MKEKIFVQIASYRDPELIPTIHDAIEKARFPDRITFGICWQHSCDDEFDDISSLNNDPRFKIYDVNYLNSKGCCWARNKCQSLWDGEEYTLQIDSHMRFSPSWDVELIKYLKLCNSDKPLLSVYPNSYEFDSLKSLDAKPSYMAAKEFDDNGILTLISYVIEDNWTLINKPFRGRFLAAGFIFTLGKFCEECKYDPYLYFHGEEMSLGARAYTHGYDIYHPHKNIIWHLYNTEDTRKKIKRHLHWENHLDQKKENDKWYNLNNKSIKRIKSLFGINCKRKNLGIYGFGEVRTLEDYENFCGVNFSKSKIAENFIYTPPTLAELILNKN